MTLGNRFFIYVLCSVCLFIYRFVYIFIPLVNYWGKQMPCKCAVRTFDECCWWEGHGQHFHFSALRCGCNFSRLRHAPFISLISIRRIWILALHPPHLPVPPLISPSLLLESLSFMPVTLHASLITPPVILPICICNYYRKELWQAPLKPLQPSSAPLLTYKWAAVTMQELGLVQQVFNSLP